LIGTVFIVAGFMESMFRYEKHEDFSQPLLAV
jgi:hypothetical protein